MGYDLHITRARRWSENRGREISAQEWLALVNNDPELDADPENGDYAVRWSAGPESRSAWLDWFSGNVYTTDPDTATVAKMLRLARELSAIVQGDRGEVYTSVEEWRGGG